MKLDDCRRALIESNPTCASCPAPLSEWCDAGDVAGDKLEYVPRLACFAGICPEGHVTEFCLAEIKAGMILARDVTERTLGRKVSQANCLHSKTYPWAIPEGRAIMAGGQVVEGPAEGQHCGWCALRWVKVAPPAPPIA